MLLQSIHIGHMLVRSRHLQEYAEAGFPTLLHGS